MSTATLSKNDLQLRDALLQQLEWDPAVDASGIGATAHEGAISLTGTIDTYAGKLAAERAAKRVAGVRAIANDLAVRLIAGRTDADIAADAATALRLHGGVPPTVQAVVQHGQLTLSGTVGWYFQKIESNKAVRHIRGVRHLVDNIVVKPETSVHDLHRRLTAALHRNASINADRIKVDISGTVVRLTGTATTWLQREAAERAAFDAPGVTTVDNQILVEPPDGNVCEIC